MSVTNPSAPDPIASAEQAVVNVTPDFAKPEVQAAIDSANAALADAASKAQASGEAAGQIDPAVEQAAKDAGIIASGGTVPLTELYHDAPAFVKEVKAGYKTTEFWLTSAVIVLAQVSALTIPGKYGPAISEVAGAAAAGLYAISRGHAKN